MSHPGVDLNPAPKGPCRALGPYRRVIVFTDLDGTLLDNNYSYHPAEEALDIIRKDHIPLIICSSKTRSEIELYQARLDITGPFISENGGAVYIPRGYFSPETEESMAYDRSEDKFRIISLGTGYGYLRATLANLRNRGHHVRGFGDMSTQEIESLTKLPGNEARLAALREFDEPFIIENGHEDMEKIAEIVRAQGLHLICGALFHIVGQSDKGKAVSILIDLYRKECGAVRTIALGDAPNDLPMLKTVDLPVIVQKSNGLYDPVFDEEKFYKGRGIGPEGWNEAILRILKGDI